MNYLAHIQLAHCTNTSLLGNFLGDFVKGDQFLSLPKHLALGVRLHRKIDVFTDADPVISEIRKSFPSSIRRMSGVALDIYFDHLLCRHWSNLSQHSFDSIVNTFYAELSATECRISQRFSLVKTSLLKHRWLKDYYSDEMPLTVFLNIEKRLQGRVTFAHETQAFLHSKDDEIVQKFLSFYPRLQMHAKDIAEQLKQQ